MADLIINQQNIGTRPTTDNINDKNGIKDHRISSDAFLIKVSQCIKIANTIRADYGIDILETNGSFDITDKIINRLDSLSSIYFQNINRNNNNIDISPNSSEQCPTEIHCISIKLPAIVELQLRNKRLLRDAINNYRRHERYSNLSKHSKISSIKTTDNEEDILMIDSEQLCPTESNETLHSSSINLPKSKESLTKLMKQIHHKCKTKTNKKKNKLITNIETILNYIINEEITYEYIQNEIKLNNQSKQVRKSKKDKNATIQILPYENTYHQYYYPNQSISIEQTMIDKIVNSVKSMAAALTNTKDVEDVLNGITKLSDQSTSPLANGTDNKIADELMYSIQKKQGYTTNRERIRFRMALDLILADNRLNGITMICRSESLILSCMLRKILLCTQTRTLCSYADVITTINDPDSHQIRLRTIKRMSLSSDEFIEIIGEMYETYYDTIETMKYYLEANDIIDMNTNLIDSSTKTSKQIDDMIKYILREDAIRLLLKLIFNRKRDSENEMNNQHRQFKLILPTKLDELYQPIKKLNAFMSTTQVMTAIRRPYLSQLTQRSKTKPITVNDLRAITSQIYLTPENFDTLITENTITSEILCQFYTNFHEIEDIDERLNKIIKKIRDHLNLHSCITRVVLKMIGEYSNGTNLTPFLDEFNKTPRFISIIDIFDDLMSSGLISITELIVYSKQDIIIKKSSLLKHFQRISFFHKRDADLLSELTLIIREDNLIEYLTQRTRILKEAYINCILNNAERRDLISSTKRLSSLSIHKFLRYFNLDPNCAKIFYWMGLTDENIVKTLIETKTFVNEYTLDGIYKNFLTRLYDTLESGSYYISAEEDNLGCFLTYDQASILTDFADPEYEQELSSLITIRDIIPQEHSKNLDLTKVILQKQEVIECKILLNSFHQRILNRQKRFKRIQNLQKLLLSSSLFNQFIDIISDLGIQYFTRIELDYLEETKLIDIGVLALLLTLPSFDSSIHQHYLHILDPIIEKYSRFLTTILVRIISNKERFSTVNEILLSNPLDYLSTNEILQICIYEQILSHDDILQIYPESFPSDTNKSSISIPDHDPILQQKVILSIFDYILHFNHRNIINGQLQQLFSVFKPLAIYKAQLLIEKEMIIIKLLLKTRKQQSSLTIQDLHKYLESYPIPCRLDIVNELRHVKLISQSLANNYTLTQCHELKSSTPELQAIFLFYMMIKLIRTEGYIDENHLKESKQILRNGFLTIEQIIHSAKDFFLHDYLNEDILKNELSEYKTVIQEEILTNILHRKQLTNTQLNFLISQNMRRRQVIQMNILTDQIKYTKISKEKVQRKVDHVLSKMDENIPSYSKMSSRFTTHNSIENDQNIINEPSPDLRSLRHNYIQAKIPRNQLHLLVEQGGWDNEIYLQFKRELDIIDSDNSLNLIQHITHNISLLLKENGSIGEKPLMKHFREHHILFQTDFDLLLNRYGMVALEDLVDLLVVSRLARAEDIESYAKRIFCLNVNKFIEISKSQEDLLVKKSHVQNNLEKRLCVTSSDLSQLLNDVLKLDRLKKIIDTMPTIKNYIRLHPINTFNALKAFKLEFDFNHYDMKFLRDLIVLNDIWYKRYLLSRTSETGPMVSEIIDEEQEQDDRHEFRFRSSADEDLDFESFNELIDTNESQLDEQRKQTYLKQIKKRKDQIDLYKSKISTNEDHLQLSLSLDDLQKQQDKKDQSRVIEQFFPEPSIVESQFLVPNQNRLFMELDFAKEVNIEDDRFHRRDIKQQTKKHRDTGKEEFIKSDTKIEDVEQITTSISKPNQSSHIIQTEEDKSEIESGIIKDNILDEEGEPSKTSIKIPESAPLVDERLPSPVESSHSKSTSVVIPEDTTESLKQMTDIEQISLKRNLKLARLTVDQWLQHVLQHNEQILKNSPHESLINNQLITYLHNELDTFHKNFISPIPIDHLTNFLQQRLNHIENILQEKKNHQEILKQIDKQIIEIDQMINEIKIDPKTNNKFNKYKEDFNQIKKQEYLEIQPILGTQLELAIRTFDADLQLIEQLLNEQILTDVFPVISKTSHQPVLQIYKDLTLIRDNLSTLATDIKAYQTISNEKKTPQDLLSMDIGERLQAIKQEYSEQKINEEQIEHLKMNIDKLVDSDQEFIDKLKEIHNMLDTQSNQIQKNLSNITTARYHSNHPNFPLNTKLKFLPVDTSGRVAEESLYLVNEQNIPISDELNLIRLPNESDRFHISNDKHELTIIDRNEIPLSEPITFKNIIPESFEFTTDDHRAVQIIETPSHQTIHKSIKLNVKPIPSDKSSASRALFVVNNNDQSLSKPIQLIDHTDSSLKITDLDLATFLYDEKTNKKVLLTPEQYLITIQQAEFTSRKFLTYIINKDKIPISEPIQISDTEIQIRHAIENTVSNKLNLFDKKRHELLNQNDVLEIISNEYELINAYIQNRLEKLKTEEKIIELIIPILDKQYNTISTDQIEYKREQSNMDNLLNTMKTIVKLDEKLTEYRKSNSIESAEIENHLIHQLIQISTQLNDPSITNQVENLTHRLQKTQLLTELRPLILSGIKHHAKIIQKNCETLLINIHKKSNQFKQPEQIRFEYIQYLTKRFNEQIENENNIENLYDKIERMEYNIGESSESINLEDLDNELNNLTPIPDYLKTKNEKLISILHSLHDKLQRIEQYKTDLLNQCLIDNEYSAFLRNQIKINQHEKLLKYIEKFKILLNKFEIDNKNNFLLSKFDHLYHIFTQNYQINLPNKTNIESIRDTLNNLRKTIKKDIQKLNLTNNELLRKLDVIKKKEELKQRTITEESQLSSLNAYIQQSEIEPINIHHEFYTMKIQQIINDLISRIESQTLKQKLSIMNSLDHLKSYIEFLNKQKNDNENKLKNIREEISIAREYSIVDSLVREQIEDLIKQQNQLIYHQDMIINMQMILNQAFDHLHSLLIHNPEQNKSIELFKQLKHRAIDTIIQSAEYNHLSKRISPHLLLIHKFTSGQELIPLLTPFSANLFQSEIKTHIEQELSTQTFLLPYQSSDIQQSLLLDLTDPKMQILQTEINYLQKQHAEAIVIGDFNQKLAAEQAISIKFQTIERLQEKQEFIEHISAAVSEKSLTENEVDEQIRRLLKNHVKLLRKRLQTDTDEISSIHSEQYQKESLQKQILHSVEDLRQLNNDLKKFRQENNRQKQIHTQLQILDKIEELDKESIDQKTLQNLRKHLHREQMKGLVIQSSYKQSHHHSHMEVLPTLPSVLELPIITVAKETIIPFTGELLRQTDSLERMNVSLATTDAREVYQELQKIRYSIEMAVQSTQIGSDIVEAKLSPEVPRPMKVGVLIEHDEEQITNENINTIRLPNETSMDIPSFPASHARDSTAISRPKKSDHEELPSSLSIVGNAQKYSIIQTKAKDRQIAKSTKRSIFQSQREYGEVYVRHRLTDVNVPISNQNEEELRAKIKRKQRLVKFEKTGKGHTVIHRQVDLPTRLLIIPQQANSEENLEPSPPLIHVTDTTNFTFKSKKSLLTTDIDNKTDHRSQKSEIILPFHSATILSPVKEEGETKDGIAFNLSNQDLLTIKSTINIKDKITALIPIDNDEKSSEKLSISHEMPSSSSTMITLSTRPSTQETQQQKMDGIPTSPLSVPNDFQSTSNIPKINDLTKPQTSKKLKTVKKKSSKKKPDDIQLITITNDDSLSTQGFDIEQENQQSISILPDSEVIYHKVGNKLKRDKKKKKINNDRTKKKRNQIETTPQVEPLVLVPRKAVPFTSATKDKQIDVEEDISIKKKKKKRKTSRKSNRKHTQSRSPSPTRKKKKSKHRSKKQFNIEPKIDNVSIEPKLIKNNDAIAMHLLNVKRFTGPPLSPIAFDQTRHKYDDIIEIPNKMIKQSRLNALKPMIKNFEIDTNSRKRNNTIQNIDAYDLDKELFDFNTDTKDIDQPAIFTEYIPELFQKQAEEKQIRRISLTAVKTNEHLSKRLAPRIPRLYNGWQPSDTICAHTDEFRPLNKYLMSDISYYFDDDFIDNSGLFQNQKNFDKIQPQVKQTTQRFRDDYIIKEFFNCWKDFTTEKARIDELRRKRVTIDFREFWFQDAFSDPFYSYFEQSPDYIKKQDIHHQMAYRLHKRLVRTGREQPKETMNYKNRSSFLPILFNLPNNHLDRQGSLTRRRQLINHENKTYPISNLITHDDDILPLIRERIHFLNQTKFNINIHRDELIIKQHLLNNSLLEQGTIEDLDRLINDYYTSLEEQEIKTIPRSQSTIVKLPMLKQSSRIGVSNSRTE